MTEREQINNDYFNWILKLIKGHKYSNCKSYLKLLRRLYDTEFTYTISLDSNRSEDGIYLRYRFSYECHLKDWIVEALLDDKPCSILEMMTALALRCEENIMIDSDEGERVDRWFWEMIESLGLNDMDDDNYDEENVDKIIQRFLSRGYKRNGEGGLFTIKDCRRDLRKAEIWYQLCWYLDTIL